MALIMMNLLKIKDNQIVRSAKVGLGTTRPIKCGEES